MKNRLIRILFFAEAVTLAHIARCVSLANALHKTGRYEIALAADSRFDAVIGELPYQRISLYSISSQYFFKKLAKGTPLYNVSTLKSYVAEDIKIIKDFKADFIIGDFRLSLAISSRLSEIPYATITNAYWSPYAVIKYPVPDIPLVKIAGVKIAQKLFDLVQPLIFKIHSLAINKVCRSFGLKPLSYDMRETYTHADYTLYADIESLLPMKSMPENHYFIGPVLWSAQVKIPDWWDDLPVDKTIVFVTLGSSGDSKLLPMLLETLSKLPVSVICVTADNAVIDKVYANVFIEKFLPAEEAVKKSDIVICNGGSPMVYQSLIEKKSIIGIPFNLDQYLMMSVIEKSGQGILIRSGKADSQSIELAVKKLLSVKQTEKKAGNGSMKTNIELIENIIQSQDYSLNC